MQSASAYHPGATSLRAARMFAMTLGIAIGIFGATVMTACAQSIDPKSDSESSLTSNQKSLLDRAADYSTQRSGRAVLILHRGELAYERYDNGWSALRPHMLASGTKSFSGVIAMMAVQDGLMSLDEPACETLTEWKEDPRKSKITIRHLLTLSSGLNPADAAFPNRRQGGSNTNPILKQRQERIARRDANEGLKDLATGNWFKDALKVPSKQEAGKAFEYGPSHFYAFGELLNRKLAARNDAPAKSFEQYARVRLLDPLGIQVGHWSKDQAGNANIPGGMFLTAREWAKFGQFVLDRGYARSPDGTRPELLKNELLAQCFVASATNRSYGLTWWLNGNSDEADSDLKVDDKRLTVWMAAGLGKQRLFILPERELVIVRFAEPSAEAQRFKNDEFLQPIVSAFSAE